jgi:uncharacterized protein YacL
MFTEAHWLFAFYYMRIAKNMPKVIEQSDEPQKDYKTVFWIGAAVNAVMSLSEFSSFLWDNYYNDSRLLQVVVVAANSGTWLCEIASGCVLVWSVSRIWIYLHETEDGQERLNLRTLVLHSTSFGLFLISTAILAVFYSIYVFTHNSKPAVVSNIIYLILSFISQCLLCVIFWVLSDQKVEEEKEADEHSFISMTVAEYDEDAEL